MTSMELCPTVQNCYDSQMKISKLNRLVRELVVSVLVCQQSVSGKLTIYITNVNGTPLLSVLIRNLTDTNEELTYSQFNKTFYARDQTSLKVSVHQHFYLKIKFHKLYQQKAAR